jgi:hypothetical protein
MMPCPNHQGVALLGGLLMGLGLLLRRGPAAKPCVHQRF